MGILLTRVNNVIEILIKYKFRESKQISISKGQDCIPVLVGCEFGALK